MTTENGKLEMEKLALRTEVLSAADLNGDADDDDYGEEASLYKRKYEWCLREIEVLKKQLKQQQEDDYDQLVLMKKQLEKKVCELPFLCDHLQAISPFKVSPLEFTSMAFLYVFH